MSDRPLKQVKACGIVLFARRPTTRFLLMRHADRWDLPKGHVDPGESELDCAIREFEEETGIPRDQIELDPTFRYAEIYYPFEKRSNAMVEKTLVLFLAWIDSTQPIVPTEHPDASWFEWQPPHAIQARTIDPVLAAVGQHLDRLKS